jgi:uncharacterized protein YciI
MRRLRYNGEAVRREAAMLAAVIIEYTKPADEVSRVREAHLAWIRANTEAGTILLSGRRPAGNGGVLVVQGESAAAVQAFCAGDPYATAGVAEHIVYDFDATSGALLKDVARR